MVVFFVLYIQRKLWASKESSVPQIVFCMGIGGRRAGYELHYSKSRKQFTPH